MLLASQSPRRRELLEKAGVDFRVITLDTEEICDPSMTPEDLCAHNAATKAAAVAALHPEEIVIGADTLVFIDKCPLGKPVDQEDAVRMLKMLQGRTHCVCTAVAVFMPGGERRDFAEKTLVTFRALSCADIERYMSLVHVYDKAGAYAAQEYGDLIIEKVEGDLDNVIGLPITRLLQVLGSSLDFHAS